MKFLPLLLILFCPGLASATELEDLLSASPTLPFAAEFDCVNAFDLFASFASLHCVAAAGPPEAGDAERIARALRKLRHHGLVTAEEAAATRVRICPLMNGTGLVPAPGRILLDDALRDMGDELFTEILAHEFVHVRQFETLGAAEFKCAYVRGMSRCGGCQDNGHPLEKEAYDLQGRVRELLARLAGQDD
ncbi:MAG: hypothetical protein FJ164_14755 [Gammaproteobacteria bacterium]|nr:hypothetical protein [Gammaproteobacteria bacterium]